MDKWRPDEWFNRHTPKVMEAGFMRKGMEALANAYEDGADNMLTARDKEWVEKEKNLVSFISLIIKREGCIDALECEHNEGCVENVLHGKCNKAQELKKEVSNGK